MIVVIQCAATKAPNAGHLVTADGKPVTFVAHPKIAPKDDKVYARPDDDAGEGRSWREVLRAYNRDPRGNPLGLLPAYRLYRNPVYIGMLPDSTEQEILFFGGKDYVPLFCKLTQNVKGKRKVFHSSGQGPSAPGCMLVKFETTTRTNWHYECVNTLIKELV
jgi:hypothetical protein